MHAFTATLDLPFEPAFDKVREALTTEPLGIVGDVDVQAIVQDGLGEDIPPYHIFGACDPRSEDRVIRSEPNTGVLLPCNFVTRETEAGAMPKRLVDRLT